jgi:hypothetical protein
MARTSYVVASMGLAFVLLLLYATFSSTDTPLEQPPGDREAAELACRTSVRRRVPNARFPFSASVERHRDGRLFLSGSVDAGIDGQNVRRNYECLLHQDRSGGYVADTVVVWQSH